MKLFEVGGCVRDEILGVKSKDIDFSVVLEPRDMTDNDFVDTNYPFHVMVFRLNQMGFKIFLETPEFLTVRAQFPKGGGHWIDGRSTDGLTADFVLARKEGEYTDGRRPDEVIPGTLEDDLARRDFSMNAIAKAPDGSYIDPFKGRAAILRREIEAVGNPMFRIREDALRAVRALRFSVTKGFSIEKSLQGVLRSSLVADALANISDERIQQELSKMFRFDTVASINILNEYPRLTQAMFAGNVSLDATMKTKGRGK